MNHRFLCTVAVVLTVFISGANGGADAAHSHTGYSYKRSLTIPGNSPVREHYEWRSFTIPAQMFGRLNASCSDIRILGVGSGGDTVEAPYLLRRMEADTTLIETPCTLINRSSTPQAQYVTLQSNLPNPTEWMRLDIEHDEFDWQVSLEGSHDGRTWFMLKENARVVSIRNDGGSYRYTDIHYPRSDYTTFRLAFKTRQTVTLNGAKLLRREGKRANYQRQTAGVQTIPTKEKNITVYRAELPYHLPVSSVALQVRNSYDFFRPLRIEALLDSVKTSKGWIENYVPVISSVITSFDTSAFRFPLHTAKVFRVMVENGDNEPLRIDSAVFQIPEHQVIARVEDGRAYTAVYGYTRAAYPDYDVVHYQEKIPDKVEVLILGEEESQQQVNTAEPASPLMNNKLWLWAVVILVIAVVGYFTYGMMTKA